jgi:hypothetical protein
MGMENGSAPRRRKTAVLALGIAIVALAVAVVLAIVPLFLSNARQRITLPLAQLVPAEVSGWTVRTLDVADSEELRNRVEQILQYDDVVFRSYRRGTVEVQVYATYWRPGSVPYGQAGVHTPDTCWVVAGWSLQGKAHGQTIRCGDGSLKPVESRRFTSKGQTLNVWFWHLVGDHVHTYEQYGWRSGLAGVRERLPNLFRDLRRYGFNLAQEQLFVRISSNADFDSILHDPAFAVLVNRLRPLGIFEDASSEPSHP